MYWLLGRHSRLALVSKFLLYKTVLKPIWTYEIPLWGTASTSNIEILQQFQNKVLWVLVNAPWYAPNWLIHSDLKVPTVREVITKLSVYYCGRLQANPNRLANILLEDEEKNRRLKIFKPSDLTTTFTQSTAIASYFSCLSSRLLVQSIYFSKLFLIYKRVFIHCNNSQHGFTVFTSLSNSYNVLITLLWVDCTDIGENKKTFTETENEEADEENLPDFFSPNKNNTCFVKIGILMGVAMYVIVF